MGHGGSAGALRKAFRAVNYIANCEHANGGFCYSCGTLPDASVTAAGPVYLERWPIWSDGMEAYLVDNRELQGHVRGSWPPGANQRNRQLGRLGVTCLSLLNLRSYYENVTLTDG